LTKLGGTIQRDARAFDMPIVDVRLFGTQATDDDLKQLKHFAKLQRLFLQATAVESKTGILQYSLLPFASRSAGAFAAWRAASLVFLQRQPHFQVPQHLEGIAVLNAELKANVGNRHCPPRFRRILLVRHDNLTVRFRIGHDPTVGD
jgi:hypothetical protein